MRVSTKKGVYVPAREWAFVAVAESSPVQCGLYELPSDCDEKVRRGTVEPRHESMVDVDKELRHVPDPLFRVPARPTLA